MHVRHASVRKSRTIEPNPALQYEARCIYAIQSTAEDRRAVDYVLLTIQWFFGNTKTQTRRRAMHARSNGCSLEGKTQAVGQLLPSRPYWKSRTQNFARLVERNQCKRTQIQAMAQRGAGRQKKRENNDQDAGKLRVHTLLYVVRRIRSSKTPFGYRLRIRPMLELQRKLLLYMT